MAKLNLENASLRKLRAWAKSFGVPFTKADTKDIILDNITAFFEANNYVVSLHPS
jgi:hypothetical protein